MRNSLFAALTASIVLTSGMSISELNTYVKHLYSAAYSLRDFLDGKISEGEWLEAVEATGLNMDEYLQVAMINSDLLSNEIETHCCRVNALK